MARIIVEGSSTAYGLWGGERGGWADRLKMAILADEHRGLYASLVNLAVPLRTSVEIADDLPANLKRYAGHSPARIALFMLGMSESRLLEGQEVVPPDAFHRSIETIIATCAAFEFVPMFLGMTPIVESKTREFKGEDVCFLESRRLIYGEIVRNCATMQGLPYFDVDSMLRERFPDTASIIDRDGLHVNDRGHAAIFDMLHPIVAAKIADLKKPVPKKNMAAV